ncbi:hypothetical protein COU20_02610 [Candidatus Kaiserbacteria bacterium CG10_big_fil_rev_8_21_14_0_10_59_10]|uniref:Blue (type 1) copper domain-containing protein n=1 Tax=Candidatus Kaiserbacteria bacterium CG10_big_fil_rev_8_21_14_0_10_59_10 TaxID=1974612 RepID=A0A2H0U7K7_9BACT|nr:MAG: hypothetical protein COU20_02610 [Candidatus Kaiserbacteria bacterium CG10_big_fil_rev_8_21_14_0_10_59_10]
MSSGVRIAIGLFIAAVIGGIVLLLLVLTQGGSSPSEPVAAQDPFGASVFSESENSAETGESVLPAPSTHTTPPPLPPPPPPPPPAAPPPAAAPPQVEDREPHLVHVTIRDFAFSPAVVRIRAGDTVVFTNEDEVAHTATHTSGVFDTGLLAQGESRAVVFAEAGLYEYYCVPHPNMRGSVIVE